MYICTYLQNELGWAMSSPIIFMGRHTMYNIYRLKVGQAVPLYNYLATGPPRASSPPGAHVRGESSQLSLTYRYLSPKLKE